MKKLKALEILKHKWISGNVVFDEKYNKHIRYIKYSEELINKAIKELEALEIKDRLAELEKVILDYYLNQGYKLFENQTEADNQWFFRTEIQSLHKQKELIITFCEAGEKDKIFYIKAETTKEMFDKAFEFFSFKV